MRSIFLVIALSTAACATTSTNSAGHTNVAAVRSEINNTIKAQNGERSIYSMGKTTPDRAVVYTSAKDGTKQEETWVKDAGAWKQEGSTKLSGAPTAQGM